CADHTLSMDVVILFVTSRRRHTRSKRDWSSDVCSSDLTIIEVDRISRSMMVWANTFPDKPVTVIKYEFLDVDDITGDETAMALSDRKSGRVGEAGRKAQKQGEGRKKE